MSGFIQQFGRQVRIHPIYTPHILQLTGMGREPAFRNGASSGGDGYNAYTSKSAQPTAGVISNAFGRARPRKARENYSEAEVGVSSDHHAAKGISK